MNRDTDLLLKAKTIHWTKEARQAYRNGFAEGIMGAARAQYTIANLQAAYELGYNDGIDAT